MSRRKHKLPQIDRTYLTHRVCFVCRVSFKRVVGTDAPCASCGGETVDLGRKFKPPKKSDDAQWGKVRLLYEGEY